MSCIYGRRQMGTEDQGWVAHFADPRAAAASRSTSSGDGCQVRDILDVSDAVDAYVAAWQHIGAVCGRAYNLGGGPDNAVSLRQVLVHIGLLTGRPVETRSAGWRAGDQRYYVSDTSLAARALNLRHPRPWRDGVATLVQQFGQTHRLAPVEGATF